jgi:hypothetical protein
MNHEKVGHMSRKGQNFEIKIAKNLSLWWTNKERDDIFWRSTTSGARATQRAKDGKTTKNSSGDLTLIDPIGQPFLDFFHIEIKRGYTKEIDLLDFLDRTKGKTQLFQWWAKCEKERKREKRKHSLVIFRRNNRETCVMMSNVCFAELCDNFKLYWFEWKIPCAKLVFLRFDDFFRHICPEDLI